MKFQKSAFPYLLLLVAICFGIPFCSDYLEKNNKEEVVIDVKMEKQKPVLVFNQDAN